MMWGCFTSAGTGKFVKVDGMMGSAKLRAVQKKIYVRSCL